LSPDTYPHPDPLPLAGEGDGQSRGRPPEYLDKAQEPKRLEHAPSPASGGGSGWGLGDKVQGIAEIGFALKDGATRLAHLYERNPLRVLFPSPVAGDVPVAVLVTTSGGLVAGDRIAIGVQVGAEAAAHVTGSAAEKIYRSTGAVTHIDQQLQVGSGGWLEFLPPETILFDQAQLRRQTRIDVAVDGGFLGGGILVFGRIAMGERFREGLLHEGWEVRRDGRLVWGDALHIANSPCGDVAAIMADPACFAGAAACATLILAPRDSDPRPYIEPARAVQQCSAADGLRAGVTGVNGLLVARWLGDPVAVRRAYAELACHLRAEAMGLPPRLPRLWHV
jgi:urease accessory protein